jgi:hypothetical protein
VSVPPQNMVALFPFRCVKDREQGTAFGVREER